MKSSLKITATTVVSHNLFRPTKDYHPPAIDGLFQGGDYKPKASCHLCFSCHNYCDITTSTYSQCLHDIEHLVIDLQGFAETNLNTNYIQVQHKLYNITKHHFPYFCSIWLTFNTDLMTAFKSGGVSLLAKNKDVSRIKHHSRD